jgi:NitT/TauT family transport system ATP-binding protein
MLALRGRKSVGEPAISIGEFADRPDTGARSMSILPNAQEAIGALHATSTPSVDVRGVEQWFDTADGHTVRALEHTDLQVKTGEFLAVVGPSGCGKTTLLNVIAGLVPQSRGTVLVNGKAPVAGNRQVGYLFARDSLMPWRTVQANVELNMEVFGFGKVTRRDRAVEMLAKVGLSSFGSAYPAQLSQGMRQRVAIARTLAPLPSILLLDEPFSALDAQTKLLLQETFSELWQTMEATVILITHDLHEAVAMADRVIIFTHRPGRIKKAIEVDLPRPRSVVKLQAEPRYHELYEDAWESLRDEVIADVHP